MIRGKIIFKLIAALQQQIQGNFSVETNRDYPYGWIVRLKMPHNALTSTHCKVVRKMAKKFGAEYQIEASKRGDSVPFPTVVFWWEETIERGRDEEYLKSGYRC